MIIKHALMFDEPTVYLPLPIGSRALSVQMQDNIPCVWMIRPEKFSPTVDHKFHWRWTGETEPEAAAYVGTVQHDGLVWHLFHEGL